MTDFYNALSNKDSELPEVSEVVNLDGSPVKKAFDPHEFVKLGFENPGPHYVMDLEVAYNRADEDELDIHNANDTTLQLDFDDKQAYINFLTDKAPSLITFFIRHNVEINGTELRVAKITQTTSNGGNTHVYITLNAPLPLATRIALQATLGSDSTREMLNMFAAIGGLTNGVLLFEKPEVKHTILYEDYEALIEKKPPVEVPLPVDHVPSFLFYGIA